MTTEIAVMNRQELVTFTKEDLDVVRKGIMPESATDAHFNLFIAQCKRTGLDPFSRQIYCSMQQGKLMINATIDGLRVIAERTGKYAGQQGPFWCGLDGKWTDVWIAKEAPAAAKVGIMRSDFTEPLWAVAKFEGYKQQYYDKNSNSWKLGPQWAKNPENMLAKCAEALALRKAFPNDLSGVYSKEEQESIENEGFRQVRIKAEAVEVESPKPTIVKNTKSKIVDVGITPSTPTISISNLVVEDAKYVVEPDDNMPVENVAGTADDAPVSKEDLWKFLQDALRNGYTEDSISSFLELEYSVSEETLDKLTKAQLAEAAKHFSKKVKP